MRQTTLNEILDTYFICVLCPVLIIPMFIWIFFPLVAGLSINDDYAYRTECMFFAVCIWLYTIWNWMVVGELIGLPFEASRNLSPNLKILIIASLLFLAVLPSVLKRMKCCLLVSIFLIPLVHVMFHLMGKQIVGKRVYIQEYYVYEKEY